jgi:hypothetical protein
VHLSLTQEANNSEAANTGSKRVKMFFMTRGFQMLTTF